MKYVKGSLYVLRKTKRFELKKGFPYCENKIPNFLIKKLSSAGTCLKKETKSLI